MTNGDAQERVVVMELSQVEIREQIIRVEGRMDVLDAKMEGIEKRMDGLDKRMDGFETRMDRLETKMDRLEAKMHRLEAKMDRMFYFMAGLTIINVGALVAALAN